MSLSNQQAVLNTECLRQIFEQLNLQDQYAAYKSCQYFEYIIQDIWNRKYHAKINFTNEALNFGILNDEEFSELFAILFYNTKELIEIDQFIYAEMEEFFKRGRFPLLEKMSFHFQKFYSKTYGFRLDLNLLTSAPNLKSLELVRTDVKHNNEDYKEFFQTFKLERFVFLPLWQLNYNLWENIKYCKTLQELHISVDHIQSHMNDILALPNLRKLRIIPLFNELECEIHFQKLNNIFNKIAEYKKDKVQSIIIQTLFSRTNLRQLMAFNNVKKLTWYFFLIVFHDTDLQWFAFDRKLLNYFVDYIDKMKNIKNVDVSGNRWITNNYMEKIQKILSLRNGSIITNTNNIEKCLINTGFFEFEFAT